MGVKTLKSLFANRAFGFGAALFVFLLLVPKPALAIDIGEGILEVIQHVTFTLARWFGALTAILFDLLVRVSNYNQFVDSAAVNIGWVVVRDITNMFFILVLLVIAFGTLFRMQKYHYTQLLRKLIIMAVLVNFSKLITGFFIDIMQVIMMTFVNAYADVAAGNLAYALGLHQIFTLDDGARPAVSSFGVTATLILALAMISITFLVILIYILMLIGRIVALWILTILSPLAYLFSTFPATQSYSSRWWSKFWQYASIGPMLAFSLWLTLTIAASSTAADIYQSGGVEEASTNPSFETTGITAFLSSVSSSSSILGFILTIMLLVIGLTMAAAGGTVGGAMAGQLAGNIQRFGVRTPGFLARAPFRVGREIYQRGAVGKFTEGAAYGLAGLGAAIPGLRAASLRQRNRIESARRERVKKHVEELKVPARTKFGSVSAIAGGNAFQRFFSSREGEARRKAAQKIAPHALFNTDRPEFLRTMADVEGVKNIAAGGWQALREIPEIGPSDHATGHDNLQQYLTPETRRWIAQSSPRPIAESAGYLNPATNERWRYDRNTDRIIQPGLSTSAAGAGAGPAGAGPGGGAAGSGGPGGGGTPFADIDREKFHATQDAIQKQFQGNDLRFFLSPEFRLNPEKYINEGQYREAMETQTRLQRQAAGMTGVRSAIRRGAQGQSVNLAVDFSALQQYGYDAGNFAGARITGEKKSKAIDALVQHYEQQGDVRTGIRSAKIDAEVDKRYQERREDDAARGEMHTKDKAEAVRDQVQTEVANDAGFQKTLEGDAAEFRRALESSSSLNLINKDRVGRSARQVLRHEQSHEAVENLTDSDLNQQWSKLSQERQKEISDYVKSNWANGKSMSLQDIQKEFFTEVLATHGRSTQLGPLKLNEKEDDIARDLGGNVALAKQERARLEVDALPLDGLEALWDRMGAERKSEVSGYIRDTFAHGETLTDEDIQRTFFAEALSAHRGGAAAEPLNFQKDERELGLLLHAATKPATAGPQAAAARAKQQKADIESVAPELRPRPPRATFVAPEQFGRTTTVRPPVAPEVVVEAPISPEIESKVIQNNQIQTIADKLLESMSRRLSELPTRTELKAQLSTLQEAASAEARRAGVAGDQLETLRDALDKLQEEADNVEAGPTKRANAQTTIVDSLKRIFKSKEQPPTETDEDNGPKTS